jgi:hypothetical protein
MALSRSALNLLLAALALALAGTAAWQRSRLVRAEQEARLWLEAAGVTRPAALDREPDAGRVSLKAARALLAAELDPARYDGVPAEEAEAASTRRLSENTARAEAVLARRPASGEAALVAGISTYVAWSRARDPRLLTSYRTWEAPLEAARELAPGNREPERFLAVAYLELWQSLSPRKTELARGLLRALFSNPEDLERFLDPWLASAGSWREAFTVLPPRALAWEKVMQAYFRRGDLQGSAAARRRWDEALLAELRRTLAQAARCRQEGDVVCARDGYLRVVEQARSERRFVQLLEQALTECPAGPVGKERAARLAPQLAAALDRCLLAECGLSPTALERLARLIRDAPPSQRALAMLYAGELAEATTVERRANAQWSVEWGPYLIARSRLLADRGRTAEAREALAQLHREWEDHPTALQARLALSRNAGAVGEAAATQARLEALGRAAWPGNAWTVRRGVQRLEIVTTAPASGLVVELAQVDAPGAVVELWLDGSAAGSFTVAEGATPLTLRQPLASGFHVLELRLAQGAFVLAGDVRLR